MPHPSTRSIADIRASSRQLVRELGFLNQTLAGSGLPASAVHALIEIAKSRDITARDLRDILLLEKSSVSRMLKSLIRKGLIEEFPSARDSRVKYLHLTQQGHVRHRVISNSAESQIVEALSPLPSAAHKDIVTGLRSYANALTSSRMATEPSAHLPPAAINSGYAPGVVGRITEMHGTFYAKLAGFGNEFENKVASELAEFTARLNSPCNLLLRAESGGRVVGSIAIDGEDLGNNLAHLRWFIMDESMQGAGIGKILIARALEFCDRMDFSATHLWTFRGLDGARHLYESHGFALEEEYQGDQWGTEVLEQKFIRLRQS